jgi:hypothetical protein
MALKLFCACIALASLSAVFAEQWQQDSDPFTFPNVRVVEKSDVATTGTHFSCRQLPGKADLVLSYSIPGSAFNARISVYSLDGTLMASFPLDSRRSFVTWDISAQPAGAGVYIAKMDCGAAVQELKIALIK